MNNTAVATPQTNYKKTFVVPAGVGPKKATSILTAWLQRQGFKPVALYEYKNEAGKTLYYRLRLEKPNGEKRIFPMSLGANVWELKEPVFPNGKPLYNLPKLIASPKAVVFVVEGENCADALSKLGIPATTSGSSSSASGTDWTPLKGHHVTLWADNDTAGERYMNEVMEKLLALGCKVERIDVSKLGLPEKGDAVDYIKTHTETTKEAIENLPIIKSQTAALSLPELWPEPESIPDTLLSVPQFDDKLLPEPYRPWVTDIADRMQCPLDYPAAASIVMTAGVIGRRIGIFPKARDSWLVVPNLWGCIIGRPGQLKTHAANAVFKPLNSLADKARTAHEAATREHNAESEVLKARREGIKDGFKKAAKANNEPKIESLKTELINLDTEAESSEPPEKRYVINDATVEKLGVILEANPQGILLYRDELTGFFANLDKHGHETDRSFYLEAWDGNGSFSYDRIGREKVYIKHACVSLFGTIQPGKLQKYLDGVLNGYSDDGLFQRLQIMVFPDEPKTWVNQDSAPDAEAMERVSQLIEKLDATDPADLGAISLSMKGRRCP